ncbi:MAG: NAD-reducing hydrogenase HoxS subunit delta [Phycisphaerae bacterium]|nr:NAD-reducing hydrogenase HoxS subunit delta [Phycisphaerae bacterium]
MSDTPRMPARIRMGTIWLEGCSGCHMSFLDMDERLIDLADKIEIVFSPYVDAKAIPDNVDVFLVEGGIGSDHDMEVIREIRRKTRVLVAFGDCAVTANVPSMRNGLDVGAVLRYGYEETGQPIQPQIPTQGIPALLPQVLPVHEVVPVDVYMPGCPPSADLIHFVVGEVLEGRLPGRGVRARFG